MALTDFVQNFDFSPVSMVLESALEEELLIGDNISDLAGYNVRDPCPVYIEFQEEA